MEINNRLFITARKELREWLTANSETQSECWVEAKRGKSAPYGKLWYLDAVEEALCFGWIDSTCRKVDGITLQRFSPRTKNTSWSELNKERCRRLIKLGLMTDTGARVLPDLDKEMEIQGDVLSALQADKVVWENFMSFPPLYRRVRIDRIQNERRLKRPEGFNRMLAKLVEATRRGIMIGEWHDYGRLIDY